MGQGEAALSVCVRAQLITIRVAAHSAVSA